MQSSFSTHKVSFIVIAKNEGPVITRCMNSIIKVSELCLDYEIIFIDSSSNDGTLEKALQIANNKTKIYQVTKNPNAAKARNIGAENAQFEYVFFVDGDVEICYDFAKVALDKMKDSVEIGCVYGQLEHVYYDTDYKNIIKIKRNIKKKLSGGIFITKKTIFQKLQGFDGRFDINEDRDLMLRLKNKYKIVYLQKKMGIHNTIPHRNFRRVRNALLNCSYKSVGLLFKKHLLSFNDLICIIREEYGSIMGGFIWILIGLSFLIHCSILGFISILAILLDIIIGLWKDPNNIVGRLISHYIYPWIILFALFFWFPKEKRSEWVRLK